MLKGIRDKLRGHIPLTNWWLVWRKLDKRAKNILDLGCGKGKPMQFINRHKQFYTVGIDGFKPYVEQCRREKSHDVVLHADIKRLSYYEGKEFDVVLCLGVLEHLEKEQGKLLLRRMEAIARKQIILFTDVDGCEQGEVDGNPFQVHRSSWSVDELRDFGFEVYGMGLKGWSGDSGYSHHFPESLRWLLGTTLQIITEPVMWFKPEWAGDALCVKELGVKCHAET